MSSSAVIDADREHARLAVLHSYRIVDTPPESHFDEIVRLASDQCNSEVATLVLVDDKRCWFKAKIGIDRTEVARDLSFCNHAFRSSGVFIVNNARLDPRFSHLPIAAKDGFNFFAGMPLISPTGHSVGVLCVLDREPRPFTDENITALKMLSARAMDLFEQRRLKEPAAPSVSVPPFANGINAGQAGVLLIVDDDDAVRSFVCLASRRLGYQIIEASNGVEALAQIEKNPGKVNLVLTDVNMPVMDGLDLVKALKKLPGAPGIAVMSGRFDPYIRSALKTEGVTALLSKPFSTEGLKTTLRQALGTTA